MPVIHFLARTVRHAPGLKNLKSLWNKVRPLYHCLLNPFGKGVKVHIPGPVQVRLSPAYLNYIDWEHYEEETLQKYVAYLRERPQAGVVDLGCSIGVFTLAALEVSRSISVVAWDADTASVASLFDICKYAPSLDRVHPVVGYCSSQATHRSSWDAIMQDARQRLASVPRSEAISRAGYQYLKDTNAGQQNDVPVYSLDHVMQGASLRPKDGWILKCDVEGAEMLVLQGGKEWLQQNKPAILLSVHPTLMQRWNHSSTQVRAFLEELGYHIEIIGAYYNAEEESWWCVVDR